MELTELQLQEKIEAAVAAAVGGLQSKNTELLGKLAASKASLETIEKDKTDELERVEQEKLASEGKLEELIERLRTTHTDEVTSLKDKLTEAGSKEDKAVKDLRKLLVDQGLAGQFLKIGVTNPDLLEAAVSLNAHHAEIIDDADGNPVVKMNDQSMEEFMTEWSAGKGKAFITQQSSGGGAGDHSSGGGSDDAEAFFQPGTINLTEQLKLQKADPDRYAALHTKYSPKPGTLPLNAPTRNVQ